MRLEDYALLGDCHTAALVARDGSIDWLCLPRFDAGACFAALVGTAENGHWRLAPTAEEATVTRRYEPGTLVLESTWTAPGGTARVLEFLALHERGPVLVRIAVGLTGTVELAMSLRLRFDYGFVVPWVTREADGLTAVAGPDRVRLTTSAALRNEDFETRARFSLASGATQTFTLAWSASVGPAPRPVEPLAALARTRAAWLDWSGRGKFAGGDGAWPPAWRQAVERSLLTLKAMTYRPTGGVVAAVTTSLPECLGGSRNWDYRFCWLRDTTFTLLAFERAGYEEEARSWYQWLLRAIAGKPSQLQVVYGLAGERRLPELELDWLRGYEGSAPVRIGNGAASQRQLDVYGEVMNALHAATQSRLKHCGEGWGVQRALIEYVEEIWRLPDQGIWEIRGPTRHFTYSKVMAWVAADRALRSAEEHPLDGPVERWRALRDEIHAEVCARGYSAALGTFTQAYGSSELDASLLLLPIVGFLPYTDPRIVRTVEAIARDLSSGGLTLRYRSESAVDGLPPGEGVFLACSFWLVTCLHHIGRGAAARELFERLLELRTDLGLLAEEYDVRAGRLVGNFPQGFSHLALVSAAYHLTGQPGRAGAADPHGQPPGPSLW